MIPDFVLASRFAWATLLLVAGGLLLLRASGTLHRVLALDVLSTVLIIVLTTLSYLNDVSYYIDAALALALLSFAATIVAARYVGRDRRRIDHRYVAAVLGSAVLLLGLAVATIGLYGMLRHPDIFEQLHAAGLVTGPGVILVLLASLASGSAEIVTSAFLVVVFLLVTSSLSTHAIALAAWRQRESSTRSTGEGVALAAGDGRAAAAMRVVLGHDGSPGSDTALALVGSLSWPTARTSGS